MKIYLMTDMEGVSGVANHDDWVLPGGKYYDDGKKLLTLEVNAAIDGFFQAGATEIYVSDGHGYGGINFMLLDERVHYIRGYVPDEPFPLYLDASFDAIAWVGQHAKAGTPNAHLAHTGWFDVLDYQINGVSVGEFGQLAMCGAALGIRSIFGAGDEAFTIEAQELIPGIQTVSVKKGMNPGSGEEYDCEGYRNRNLASIHRPVASVREEIRTGAKQALIRLKQNKEQFPLIPIQAPYEKRVSYRANKGTPAYVGFAQHPTDVAELINSKAERSKLSKEGRGSK